MKLVERPQVVARLCDAVAEHALTFVAAPLGVGKSSALALAFGDVAGFARLEVEPWHRGALVAALVATVRRIRDDFGRLTLGALAVDVPAHHLGRTFALELRHLDAPLVIAIDNAHLLYDDPEFGEFLRAALAELPEPVRLILVGRALPNFELVEAFASRRATVIHNDAFRFNATEIRALASSIGRELDDTASAAIEASTDGWAAAIVLALTTRSDGVPALRSPDAAAAYLDVALLPTLTPAAVEFLEATSVFETLDLELLECSPLFRDARALLASLQRSGALVSELPDPGRYRVHPILRDLALKRLAVRGALTTAHSAAVDVYVRAHATSAALYHVVATDDARIAGAFLRAHADAAIGTGDRARVRAAAALIDADGDDGDVAAFVRGLDEKATGSPESRASFARAAEGASRSGDASIGFFARAQIIEYDLSRLRRVDLGELADIRVRARALGPLAVATAEMLSGWAQAIGFEFGAARDRVAPLTRAGDAAARSNTGILYAYAQTALGEFDAAQKTLDDLVQMFENDDRVVLQTIVLVWFARLALAWGATNTAHDAAAQAERLAVALDFHAQEAALYGVLTELATHRGDAIATVAYAERARERARSAWYVVDIARIRTFAEIATARAAFLGHDNAIARSIALHAAEMPDIPEPTRALALAEAAMYTLLCDPPSAAGAIAAARAATRNVAPVDIGDVVALTSAGDLLAFLSAANGERMTERCPLPGPFDALVAERRGLVTLEFAGIAVANARRGQGSAEALSTAFERITRNGPRFEVRLARAYASRYVKHVKRPSNAPPAFDLTLREREILALLVDGLTNKEIAQRIVVSPRTAETHVERILSKLEVGSRSRAIAKALRVGIVELPADP